MNYKLLHWLNARKLTVAHVAKKTGWEQNHVDSIFAGTKDLSNLEIEKLASILDVDAELIRDEKSKIPLTIFSPSSEMLSSKREVIRDGIHFYNYFTLPSPRGYICPVILDILCPSDRYPQLNNGHLEPAITINLGPGDISGRWDERLYDESWRILRSNAELPADLKWIVGDSYFEPSYQPHSYCLASETPARILSYTAASPLYSFLDSINKLDSTLVDRFLSFLDDRSTQNNIQRVVLDSQMRKFGFDTESLAEATGYDELRIKSWLDGTEEMCSKEIEAICSVTKSDSRMFCNNSPLVDKLGKVHLTAIDSSRSVRKFSSYDVASVASCSSLPDLAGVFMLVSKSSNKDFDIYLHQNAHYLVTDGNLRFRWIDSSGEHYEQQLHYWDSLWVAPFVEHCFEGDGSLIRMTNGDRLSYLDFVAMSNTFHLKKTIFRGYKDGSNWGYENQN
jgi:2-hydroxyethylphosphonate dioxygenase